MMSKRKLDEVGDPDDIDISDAKRLRLRRMRFDETLTQSIKILHRALKAARISERQKLGRRQKEAKTKSESDSLPRLDAEIAALKSIDLAATSELYLSRKLCSIKSFTEASAFPSYVRVRVEDSAGQNHDPAYTNVTARLYRANPVRTAMEPILGNLSRELGTETLKKVEIEGKKRRLRKADFALTASFGHNDYKNEVIGATNVAVNVCEDLALGSESEFSGFDSESDDYETYAGQLANRSNDESIEDNKSQGSPELDTRQSSFSPVREIQQSFRDDIGLSNHTSDDSDNALPGRIKRPKSASAPVSTTFLPSLTMGGYWSGSDSGSIDSDNEATDLKARKNRRGQRARRAIAEKKFGAMAKHIKDAPAASRDQGWDARKGAQGPGDSREERRRRRMNTEGAGRGFRSSGANNDPVGPRTGPGKKEKGAEGKMHPSWEAAKRKKEQKTEVAFTGKKIVFN